MPGGESGAGGTRSDVTAQLLRLREKYSIARVQIASRFFHWNTRHVTYLVRVSPVQHEQEMAHVFEWKKARRDLNASDTVFLRLDRKKLALKVKLVPQDLAEKFKAPA